MSRILFTTMSPLSYGSTQMLLHYAIALQDAGHQITVAYDVEPDEDKHDTDSILPELSARDITVVHVPRLSLSMFPFFGSKLLNLIRSEQIELVIATQLRDAAGAMSAAAKARVLGVVFAQGTAIFRGSPLVRYLKKIFYRKALAVRAQKAICVAPAVRNRLISYLKMPADNSIVILNGLDMNSVPAAKPEYRSEVRKELGLDANQFFFLNIGRFDPVKGLDILVEAVRLMHQGLGAPAIADFKVVIAAEAYSELTAKCRNEISQLIDSYELNNYFEFIGFRKDCNRLLQASDCFLLPSRSEGLPLVVLEAFAARCPVIMSEYGVRFAQFRNDIDGSYVPVGDPQSLANAMRAMFDKSPEERDEIGANGRSYLESHLTLQSGKQQFVEQINQVLQQN